MVRRPFYVFTDYVLRPTEQVPVGEKLAADVDTLPKLRPASGHHFFPMAAKKGGALQGITGIGSAGQD